MTTRNQIVGLFSKSFNDCSDLMCCAFGLRNTDSRVYFELLFSGSMSVEDLASAVGRERSVVQRALKKLLAKGLVVREKVQTEHHLEQGGYLFEYSAVSDDIVKDQILEQLDSWYRETRSFLLEKWSRSVKQSK
ncbi:MarR family transcriptional regulator [Candidatus Thorarchaeota archaeon]|jgi:predicted transcriptional regulator|nr:MAG: MarR family transcriptional regulator [Candidatus Thorarchaeota archaeon]